MAGAGGTTDWMIESVFPHARYPERWADDGKHSLVVQIGFPLVLYKMGGDWLGVMAQLGEEPNAFICELFLDILFSCLFIFVRGSGRIFWGTRGGCSDHM